MEISHNFCINTRVGKVGFFLGKKRNAPNHTHPLSKKCHRSDPKCYSSTQGAKDSLVRKDFCTSCHLFPKSHLCASSEPVSWATQGNSMVQSWGIRKVLLGLCSLCPMWRERVKQLLLQTSPNAALFFMPLFDQGNPRNSTNTVSPQQSSDIISIASGSMTAKWRQAGLLLREIPITIMICWVLETFAVYYVLVIFSESAV